ncbi:hypothetical protein BZM27_22815 [Paraburkholderia steynii]|uniref:Pilus assembly protein n=1 Tax=Paraburkholderia steynii TaxID=1245441 RepID=A0A4R0X9J1_9BURK|nr:hypothetical protein BZM27_22815 [Paraburkholderia steynii]
MKTCFTPIAAMLGGAACILLTSCMSTQPPLDMPDVSVIGFVPGDGGYLTPPACNALNQRSDMVDAGYARPGVAFGCATYSNLAAMIARPADVLAPVPYPGADAPLAASAVRRYEEGHAMPLTGWSATSSSSGSPSTSSSGSQ